MTSLILLALACSDMDISIDTADIQIAEAPAKPAPKPPAQPKASEEEEETQIEAARRRPKITKLRFEPKSPVASDDITADAATRGNEGVYLDFDYTWTLNGNTIYEVSSATLPARYGKKGDQVTVHVRVSDGTHHTERTSEVLTIANAAPEIVSDPKDLRSIDGFQVRAKDPDGDDIKFSLRGAPEGMTIHPTTGRLTYKGSKEAEPGSYKVAVIAKDVDGAGSQWVFGIEVAEGAP